MPNYSVLYAQDVSHYATTEIEADNGEDALKKGKANSNIGDLSFEDPDWNNPVCLRIVHMEDPQGALVAQDVPLDDFFLRNGGDPDRRLCENAEEMFKVLEAARSIDWVHNAAITDDIEALRKIYLAHASWWNDVASPLIRKVKVGAA